MGLNKRYRGYKSFDYLEKDDYRTYKLVKEIGRVEPYTVPLSVAEEDRVNRIVGENVVISFHEHPVVFPEDTTLYPDVCKRGRFPTAFEGLSKSCLDGVFDNLLDGGCVLTSKAGWKWEDAIVDLGMRLADIEHQDFVITARKVDDILQAYKEGQIAFIWCMEGAMPIENELDRIDILYGFGLRVLMLTYSESNALGTGSMETRDGGLTYFGRQCVDRMNKLGMAVDVAHCSDQTALDTARESKKPIFDTHGSARGLHPERGKSDDTMKAIADKGGVLGFLSTPGVGDMEAVMRQFEYLKNLCGIESVAFAPDTIYGDHLALYRTLGAERTIVAYRDIKPDAMPYPYVKGMENPTEASWNTVRLLVQAGYSDEDVAKVIGGNVIRALREIWY